MKHILFKILIIVVFLSFSLIASGICGTYIYYDEDGNPIILADDTETSSNDSSKGAKTEDNEAKVTPLNTGPDSIKTR